MPYQIKLIKSHARKGGPVKEGKGYRAKAHTRKGKPVKQSIYQYNRAHNRKGTWIKAFKKKVKVKSVPAAPV